MLCDGVKVNPWAPVGISWESRIEQEENLLLISVKLALIFSLMTVSDAESTWVVIK